MLTFPSIDEELFQHDNSQRELVVFSACPVTPSATRFAGRSIVKGNRPSSDAVMRPTFGKCERIMVEKRWVSFLELQGKSYTIRQHEGGS